MCMIYLAQSSARSSFEIHMLPFKKHALTRMISLFEPVLDHEAKMPSPAAAAEEAAKFGISFCISAQIFQQS